eukprot:CAMPEP_0202686652 /NCGR_PEP_ID=MMETSP1385-20130828/2410_1 /ASSEMBLY_ACC=CAM_ASM_000861 /TAXON_ID=933848 /ORGANISM="Elphidium margaritaceum" /LENGTH=409 /DNA_ID=CAMNT_0049341273 /DNA_START=129 /DNA_END=1358 /DNA_ORIENTATION=-
MPVRTRSATQKLKRSRAQLEDNQAENKSEEEFDTIEPRRKKQKRNGQKDHRGQEALQEIVDETKKPKKARKNVRKREKSREVVPADTEISIVEDDDDHHDVDVSNSADVKDRTVIDKLKCKHRELLQQGYECVVGCDEAGRGPLAGPVVISAAYVPIDVYIDGITDSKKINDENEREKLYALIMANERIKHSVCVLSHDVIDQYNILEASMMGMRQCVLELHDALVGADPDTKGVDYVLCDGNRDPKIRYPTDVKYEYIIKGDSKIYCIGAASIIAKVTRDRLMIEYDQKYPVYQFAQNKGYPTPLHKRLVLSKGPCDIHRKTFKPVKNWYQQHKPAIYERVEKLKKETMEKRKKQEKATKGSGKNKTKTKVKKQAAITKFIGASKNKKKKKESNEPPLVEEQKDAESE